MAVAACGSESKATIMRTASPLRETNGSLPAILASAFGPKTAATPGSRSSARSSAVDLVDPAAQPLPLHEDLRRRDHPRRKALRRCVGRAPLDRRRRQPVDRREAQTQAGQLERRNGQAGGADADDHEGDRLAGGEPCDPPRLLLVRVLDRPRDAAARTARARRSRSRPASPAARPPPLPPRSPPGPGPRSRKNPTLEIRSPARPTARISPLASTMGVISAVARRAASSRSSPARSRERAALR